MHKITELKRLQAEQAEKALEEFKQQVEHNSSRMFDDMKAQMQKVEADLLESKELRQTQTKEYTRQLDQERKSYAKQVSGKEMGLPTLGQIWSSIGSRGQISRKHPVDQRACDSNM